jgi:hypothetical protein
MRKKVTKEILNVLLAILVSPVFVSLYMMDRIITTCIPVIKVVTIQIWLTDTQEMGRSVFRVATVGFLYGLYLIISALLF